MEQEIWKDIAEYEGKYQISNLGRVKSLINKSTSRELILKPRKHNSGYYSVCLCINGNVNYFMIHRLVVDAFILNLKNYDTKYIVCDHINGIRTDNNVSNLRVVTKRENSSVCFRKNQNKLISNYIGSYKVKGYNKWTSILQLTGKSVNLGSFNTEIEAANAYQAKLKEIRFAENGIEINFPSIESLSRKRNSL